MLDENELLFDELYEKTKDCGRTQFIKLLMSKERENQQLKEKVQYLKEKSENKDRWCQLIADIGYDYDGYRKAEDLMKLIDELVTYALYARDDYDYLEWEKEGNE